MADDIISRDEAKAQGLKRFFTCAQCKNGHTNERYVVDGKCVACVAKRAAISSRRWALNNPKKVLAKTEKWRKANPELWKASNKRSKSANQKRYNDLQRADYAKDSEKYRAAWHRYYLKNRAAMIERGILSESKRRAISKGGGGSHTTADLAEILKAQNYRCAYCCADLRKVKRHVDHIQPLSLGGSNDRTNIQYLCAPCNLTKGAKDPILFAQELGRLL